MPYSVAGPLLENVHELTGVKLRPLRELPENVQRRALECVLTASHIAQFFTEGSQRFVGCRYGDQASTFLIAGPYSLDTDSSPEDPIISADLEQRLFRAVETSSKGLAAVATQQRERVEIESQFELLSSAVIAISGELSLENVLIRIVDLARSVSGAKYAALGLPGPSGGLESFITSGISPEEHASIGELPSGRGLLGTIMSERKSMRIRDIAEHPDSVGFPPNHPPMRSFLGVPITAHGNVLGNLYLTEKRFADEFSSNDEQLVELLARHAAVAIENARLYAKLEAQEERLGFIIDQLPEAVILVEADPERVTLANRQASTLLGWELDPPIELEDFLERNPRIGDDGTSLSLDEIPVVRSIRSGETITRNEVSIERPDGKHLTLLLNSAPLHQPDGTVSAAIIVFQDISLLKDAEQLKDDFLSLVSHELRTPLTTIHGGSHLLLEAGLQLDPETQVEILGDIYSESKRLANLVENMVQLANIRAGRFQVAAEPVNVRLLIQRALRGIDLAELGREIRVGDTRNLLATGDVESLDQVLRNLVQNAIKYVPDESPIEIDAMEVDDMVQISVRDHGRGVDPDDLPLLFDRFQRGRNRESTAGMGLGLYLSRMIVEAHGGSLWLELPEGGGSRFVFSIPPYREE